MKTMNQPSRWSTHANPLNVLDTLTSNSSPSKIQKKMATSSCATYPAFSTVLTISPKHSVGYYTLVTHAESWDTISHKYKDENEASTYATHTKKHAYFLIKYIYHIYYIA